MIDIFDLINCEVEFKLLGLVKSEKYINKIFLISLFVGFGLWSLSFLSGVLVINC